MHDMSCCLEVDKVVIPKIPTDTQEILARTIWGEARGEGERGMEAVACVIVNRAEHPRWWGRDIARVCLRPLQFSCWNPSDTNRVKMMKANCQTPMFLEACDIARRAIAGELEDITNGADHYHAVTVRPKWTDGAKPVAHIGNHLFYRLEI